MPIVSVIMSVYNEPLSWIRQSVDSILRQSFSDFEFIIVIDSPWRDELSRLLLDYRKADARIVLLRNDDNIGLTRSLNRGLAQASGRYVARMDADDISTTDRLLRQVDFMESHPDVIVLGSRYQPFGRRTLLGWLTNDHWVRLLDIQIKAQMLTTSCFVHPSVLIRRSVLVDNGISYDENYRTAQDYRLWEQLHNLGPFANLPDRLIRLRTSNRQVSASSSSSQLQARTAIRRRCIEEWLHSIGHSDILGLPDALSQRKALRTALAHPRRNPFYRAVMQTFYYSNTRHRLRTMLVALLSGEIFFFNNAEKLRFVAISFRLKPADIL